VKIKVHFKFVLLVRLHVTLKPTSFPSCMLKCTQYTTHTAFLLYTKLSRGRVTSLQPNHNTMPQGITINQRPARPARQHTILLT